MNQTTIELPLLTTRGGVTPSANEVVMIIQVDNKYTKRTASVQILDFINKKLIVSSFSTSAMRLTHIHGPIMDLVSRFGVTDIYIPVSNYKCLPSLDSEVKINFMSESEDLVAQPLRISQ